MFISCVVGLYNSIQSDNAKKSGSKLVREFDAKTSLIITFWGVSSSEMLKFLPSDHSCKEPLITALTHQLILSPLLNVLAAKVNVQVSFMFWHDA